jgi:SAM-dependent methyltransferase
MLRALKRFRPFLIAYSALRNAQARRRYESGKIDSIGGSTTVHRPLDESLAYIYRVFSDFNQYAGLSPERVSGQRMAEIGPGDNLGIGLLYLAWGAASYTGLDRFYSVHDEAQERAIYLALREKLDPAERTRFDDAVNLGNGIQFNPSKIRYLYGHAAESCDEAIGPAQIDILLSRVVIQSVDLDQALPAMHRLLAPGGTMAHKIDFRDLGIFLPNGFHALEFRTLPDDTYLWMIQRGDHPNRRHLPYYREKLTALGYSFRLLRTGIITPTPPDHWKAIEPHTEDLQAGTHYSAEDVRYVESIRPRLIQEFRNLTVDDLLTAGVFLIASKP